MFAPAINHSMLVPVAGPSEATLCGERDAIVEAPVRSFEAFSEVMGGGVGRSDYRQYLDGYRSMAADCAHVRDYFGL